MWSDGFIPLVHFDWGISGGHRISDIKSGDILGKGIDEDDENDEDKDEDQELYCTTSWGGDSTLNSIPAKPHCSNFASTPSIVFITSANIPLSEPRHRPSPTDFGGIFAIRQSIQIDVAHEST
jgi:hypothetical protein